MTVITHAQLVHNGLLIVAGLLVAWLLAMGLVLIAGRSR